MAEHDTRIRWTGKERDIVVREYQALCASDTGWSMTDLLVAAQKALPKERQRPPSYALRAWFNKELKSKLELDARRSPMDRVMGGQTATTPFAAAASATTITSLLGRNGAGKPLPVGPENDRALQQTLAAALRSALLSPMTPDEIKALIDTGVEVAVGILANSRVRQAMRGMLDRQRDEPFVPSRTTFQTSATSLQNVKVAGTDVPAETVQPVVRSGKMRVLIAGPAGGQLADVRSPYEDHLELESWSPDQGFEQLRTLVDSVDVVIGMPTLLTQAVQNTLRHYAKRYVRHTTGIAGLGGELGKLLPDEAK